MGMLINGIWQKSPFISGNKQGEFVREDALFRNTISDQNHFKAEPNRYHLYISYACPWASRTLIFRKLKKLEDIISLSTVEPIIRDNGWEFGKSGSATADPLYSCQYLYEIYQKAQLRYTGKVTVPILWDKKLMTIVNNESSEIIRILNSSFYKFTDNQYDYYPKEHQSEIDQINAFIYDNINNGVYKCGFATSQKAYEIAFDALFQALDKLEERLKHSRYLLGNFITEADWRLFTTLIRFDAVYHYHFKCNLKRLDDYHNLSNYCRELYQIPGIRETVKFDHIKEHYYKSHKEINPSSIIPKGPILNYDKPHDREIKTE